MPLACYTPDMTTLSAGRMPDGRRPTPRPRFTEPQLVRRVDAVAHVWGDDEAGYVTDRVISSTDQLHVLEFELAPGGGFRHSAMNPTVFGADVLYYVLSGGLVLANPETGEVTVTEAGSGRLFHRGTWHNGFSASSVEPVRVLEFFSPPPSRGAASEFARRQPALTNTRYRDDRWDARWPQARSEHAASTSFARVAVDNALMSLRDHQPSHLNATLVSTPYLHVIEGSVQPGHVEPFRVVERESVLHVLEGELWVDVWSDEVGYQATSILAPGDSMFLPVGCSERLLVRSASPARYLRGSGEVPSDWTP
ncbi:hypothetical protein AVP41_02450 [Microbacterium sp. TNHR37B]|nr:hypothetical protein AVP41_02450 [Microbacterium sp. TNHR37B]